MSAREAIEKEIMEKIRAGRERFGKLLWQMPWTRVDHANYVTGRRYTGMNAYYLPFIAALEGFQSALWLTPNQCKKLGGDFSGQKTTLIPFWTVGYKGHGDGSKLTEAQRAQMRKDGLTYSYPRYYRLFNADQVKGIPAKANMVRQPAGTLEAIFAAMENAPTYREGTGNACFYTPATDTVSMVAAGQFSSLDAYWQTRCHEMIHATGHASRLARPGVTDPVKFGSHAYAAEELVAEFGAAMLMGEAGLAPCVDNSAAYIDGWLSKLEENPMVLMTAAGQASKAVDFILGRKASEASEEGAE